jgi:hypothetical protein
MTVSLITCTCYALIAPRVESDYELMMARGIALTQPVVSRLIAVTG